MEFSANAAKQIARSVQRLAGMPPDEPFNRYAQAPDGSSPEIHPVLCTSNNPDPVTGYFPGFVLSINTSSAPPVKTQLGEVWLWAKNGEQLAANTIYDCRFYGPNIGTEEQPGDGRLVCSPVGSIAGGASGIDAAFIACSADGGSHQVLVTVVNGDVVSVV
jgi:hypothetical protein